MIGKGSGPSTIQQHKIDWASFNIEGYVTMILSDLYSLEQVQNSKPNKKRKHLFAVLINYSSMGGVHIGVRAARHLTDVVYVHVPSVTALLFVSPVTDA